MAVYISSEASEINHSQAADESKAEGSDPGVGYTTPKRGRRYFSRAVSNRWTGLLEWTTGMDYWNGL